jgi:hypothetical protein
MDGSRRLVPWLAVLVAGTVQVTYDGKPLYTYVGDSGPGQATGQGVANFFAATPTASGGTPGAQPGASDGYYP